MTWTPAAESTLRDLAAKGWSGAQIAKRLSAMFKIAVTRSAVISKTHRLGLVLRGGESAAERKASASRAAKARWADPGARAQMSADIRRVKGGQGGAR